MKDFQPGVTAPPFHVNCRSTTAPYFDENFGEIGKRAARDEKGKTYYVPEDMNYSDWKKVYVDKDLSYEDWEKEHRKNNEVITESQIGLSEPKVFKFRSDKLKSVMKQEDYNGFINLLKEHNNDGVKALYEQVIDEPSKIVYGEGAYEPTINKLTFDYPDEKSIKDGIGKYNYLAHEYAHCIDNKVQIKNLHFTEIDTLNSYCQFGNGSREAFKPLLSNSDEFLQALRKDIDGLNFKYEELKEDIRTNRNFTGSIQDTVAGLLSEVFIKNIVGLNNDYWSHDYYYYGHLYKKLKNLKLEKRLEEAFKKLSIPANNQSEVKNSCRIYMTASETFANIIAAIVCNNGEIKYMKKYLPSSYECIIKILDEV